MSIRIMLADDNREFVVMVQQYIEEQPDMELIAVAHHGEEALQVLHRLPVMPDILLLDIIMPHLDGLGVLEQLAEWKLDYPKVIMITAFGQEHITKKAVELGASYYMLKPFDVHILGDRIRQLAIGTNRQAQVVKPLNLTKKEPSAVRSLESEVTAILNELAIPAHIKGYRFLRDAIMMVYNDMAVLGAITNVLYPQIAEKYNSTSSRVERAIRHAISSAWERNKLDGMQKYGGSARRGASKPTNSEFIAAIADYLILSHEKPRPEQEIT